MTCDIIIPVWNQLQLTKECIDSISEHTKLPYNLIIIDNNSDKETENYLKSLKGKDGLNVALIRNEQNLGFAKAINQGMKVSHADYICLLNNDTQVYDGWLKELINVAQSNLRIGIVNPGGTDSSYGNSEIKGKWSEIGFATGFCMLIKKEVKEKVGLLDEAFDVGFFEDTDYCKRAKNAGYICVSAKASCVYHHEHKTFEFFDKDSIDDLFEKNKEIFYKKWGKILHIAYVSFRKNFGAGEIDRVLKLVKDGHMVYLFIKNSTKFTSDFDHGSIREFRTPFFFFVIFAGGKILIRNRQKNRFGKVMTDSQGFINLMKFLNHNLQVELI